MHEMPMVVWRWDYMDIELEMGSTADVECMPCICQVLPRRHSWVGLHDNRMVIICGELEVSCSLLKDLTEE